MDCRWWQLLGRFIDSSLWACYSRMLVECDLTSVQFWKFFAINFLCQRECKTVIKGHFGCNTCFVAKSSAGRYSFCLGFSYNRKSTYYENYERGYAWCLCQTAKGKMKFPFRQYLEKLDLIKLLSCLLTRYIKSLLKIVRQVEKRFCDTQLSTVCHLP